MPHIISRDKALKDISGFLKENECLVCWIVGSSSNRILYESALVQVSLSRYPRTWGQTMILLKSHKESFSDITSEEWNELMHCIKKTTLCIEKALKPLRVYVASLGALENLPHTCPHVHFNVLPIYLESDRPTQIFTWENGLYGGSEEEWDALFEKLKKEF